MTTIVVTDDEGNPHQYDPSYENDPWSGLAYAASHSLRDNPGCPIANGGWGTDEYIGNLVYTTREGIIEAFA